MKDTLITVLCIVSLVSCTEMNEELAQVTSIQQDLTQTEEKFNSWELNDLIAQKEKVDSRLNAVSSYYKESESQMSMDAGMIMSEFKGAGKAYKRVTADHAHLKSELELSHKQLDDLKRDIESGAVKREQVQHYISEEAMAVKTLKHQVFHLDTVYSNSVELYEKLVPRVDSLIATWGTEVQ